MHDLTSIEGLRKACEEAGDYPDWWKKILDLLKHVENASLEERKSEEFHRRIWDKEYNSIGGAGQGENIVVDQAIGQEKLRSWLAEESRKPLPDDRQERLEALEEILKGLIDRVKQSGVEKYPRAETTRVLAALFPSDFTVLIADSELTKFLEKIGIKPRGTTPSKHRQILDKMDEALGRVPDDDLEQLARRMTLPWMLMELTKQEELTPKSETIDNFDQMTSSPTEETAKVEATIPQNVILYGPPGTGKTYSTTRRALELILGKDKIEDLTPNDLKSQFREYQIKGQIEFVTFHQSYGYEEFVEGLRPVLDDTESDDVRYELHDGVFKRISLRAAAEGLKPTEEPDFDYLWARLVAEIREDDERIVYSTSKKSYVFRLLNLSTPHSVKIRRCEVDDEGTITCINNELTASKEKSKTLWDQRSTFEEDPKNLTEKKAKEIFGVGTHYTALWIVYKHLLEVSRNSGTDEDLPIDNAVWRQQWVQQALDKPTADGTSFSFSSETRQYVLIIDEINRGNVSKILGELITLLEPDKRLEAKNELKLPLSYSPEHRFGVPPNLHILGTMNTADRSIAIMDVALRRRFKFEELMPDEKVRNCHEINDLLCPCFVWFDRVIPIAVERMRREADAFHLLIADDHPFGIRTLVYLGANAKSGGGGRCTDQMDHRRQTDQGLAAPVHGDIREQTMLDAVPFAGAGRIVADRDSPSGAIGKALQLPFPPSQSGSVAAPGIGRDQKMRGTPVGRTSHVFPPASDRVHREMGGVVSDAYTDPTLIATQVIDPIRNGLALGGDHEVVHPHPLRVALGTPGPAAILEIADKFLLFGIYRNDRMAFFLSTLYLLVEIVELGVPIRVLRPFFGLSIRLQGVAEPVQQPVDDAATQRVAQSLQLSRQRADTLRRPTQGAVVGRPGGGRLEQGVEVRHQRGVRIDAPLATPACPPRTVRLQRFVRSELPDTSGDPRPRHARRSGDQSYAAMPYRFGLGGRPQATRAFVQHRRQGRVLCSQRFDIHTSKITHFLQKS